MILPTIDYGISVVAPLAAELALKHPELRVEIVSSDSRTDMVAEGIDLAIRVGRLADSSHKAALITHFEEWVVAPPALFAQGLPKSPSELEQHPFVALSVLPNPLNWNFVREGHATQSVKFSANIMANTSASVRAAVLAGAGFMIQPNFSVVDDIQAGRLIRVLADWTLPGGGIYAVFPSAVQRSYKVGVFIAALKERYPH